MASDRTVHSGSRTVASDGRTVHSGSRTVHSDGRTVRPYRWIVRRAVGGARRAPSTAASAA